MIDPYDPSQTDFLFRKIIAAAWPEESGKLRASPSVPIDVSHYPAEEE